MGVPQHPPKQGFCHAHIGAVDMFLCPLVHRPCFPLQCSPASSMPRPSAELHMPPPPPRLPPLHKGGSGQFSAGSTPKVTLAKATDDNRTPHD
jgi:hypothetical protein